MCFRMHLRCWARSSLKSGFRQFGLRWKRSISIKISIGENGIPIGWANCRIGHTICSWKETTFLPDKRIMLKLSVFFFLWNNKLNLKTSRYTDGGDLKEVSLVFYGNSIREGEILKRQGICIKTSRRFKWNVLMFFLKVLLVILHLHICIVVNSSVASIFFLYISFQIWKKILSL